MSFSTSWVSDGTSSVSPVGGSGGNRLPDEACGEPLPARFKSFEEKFTKDGKKKFLVYDMDVWYLSEMFSIRHHIWSSAQFSSLATLMGLPQGAIPPHLQGKTVNITCELKGEYINISKIEPRDANAQAEPKPTPADEIPF